MNKQNYKIAEDGCTVDSIVDVMVSWLDRAFPVLFELEDGHNWWSRREV